MTQSSSVNEVSRARCISLVTFKKDGTRVATPVWFNVIDGKIFVTTPPSSWKVKRIANNPRVEFAACTQRGKVTGPIFTGRARVLPDEELPAILTAKRKRYPLARIIQLMPGARAQAAIEITGDI